MISAGPFANTNRWSRGDIPCWNCSKYWKVLCV